MFFSDILFPVFNISFANPLPQRVLTFLHKIWNRVWHIEGKNTTMRAYPKPPAPNHKAMCYIAIGFIVIAVVAEIVHNSVKL